MANTKPVSKIKEKRSTGFVITGVMNSGLFSLLSRVIVKLKQAEMLGFIPVVDFQNFQTVYSESEIVNGSFNVWDYYFEPVSKFKLEDIYSADTLITTTSKFPIGESQSISSDKDNWDIFNKYIKINKTTEEHLNQLRRSFEVDNNTLGVHFRGQEMRTAQLHPFPPSFEIMKNSIKGILENHEFDRIFLVTEKDKYHKQFKNYFGSRIVSLPNYRSNHKNMYKEYPRSQHLYLLGLELLADGIYLSKCGGLITSKSNVTEFSKILNGGRYKLLVNFDLGTNSPNPIVAKYNWYLKIALPNYLNKFL